MQPIQQTLTPRETSGGLTQPRITLRRPALSRYADPPSTNLRGSLSARRHDETTLMSTHLVEGWTGGVVASLAATRKTVPWDQALPIRDPHTTLKVTDCFAMTYKTEINPRGQVHSLGVAARSIVETPEPTLPRWPVPQTCVNWRSHAQPGIVPQGDSMRTGITHGQWYSSCTKKMTPRGYPAPGGGPFQFEPSRTIKTKLDQRPLRPFTHASVAGANTHYLKALDWLEKDEPFRGETELRRTLEKDPNHVAGISLLGKLEVKLRNDYVGAQRNFEKALALEPGNAMALGGLAALEENINLDFDKAEALYHRAVKADPSDAHLWANFSLFFKHCRKDPIKGRDMMVKAFQVQPGRPWFQANAANFDT